MLRDEQTDVGYKENQPRPAKRQKNKQKTTEFIERPAGENVQYLRVLSATHPCLGYDGQAMAPSG